MGRSGHPSAERTPPGPFAVLASSAAAITARRSPPVCAAMAADTAPRTNGASTMTTRSAWSGSRNSSAVSAVRNPLPRSYSRIAPAPLSAFAIAAVISSNEVPIPPSSSPPAGGDRHRRRHLRGDVGQTLRQLPAVRHQDKSDRHRDDPSREFLRLRRVGERLQQVSGAGRARVLVPDRSFPEVAGPALAGLQRDGGLGARGRPPRRPRPAPRRLPHRRRRPPSRPSPPG